MTSNPLSGHKLLVANRGEIAVRIIQTAKSLGLSTVAIYTPSDAISPHIALADESVPLSQYDAVGDGESEAKGYMAAEAIVSICLAHSVTMLHPGYGFLSENADFASLVADAGVIWLGPRSEIIRMMGLKHEARKAALKAGVPVVPGSRELLGSLSGALEEVLRVGYPVVLKATAGGGGLGITLCENEKMLVEQFALAQQRAKALFGVDGIFAERYFSDARHVEIQVFGNGLGHVVHMSERECSVQRRHQKIIEESPSPFVSGHAGLKERMCTAAVSLCKSIKYNSAGAVLPNCRSLGLSILIARLGTVEFIIDDTTGEFYFLEMNTRIQVEHPVTEMIYPTLDLVELMIRQGLAEYANQHSVRMNTIDMTQETYDKLRTPLDLHAIEGRIYAENPARGFVPSPGILQNVELNVKFSWLRVESWVTTGTLITPFFDGLLCKIIVTGSSREEAIARFRSALAFCKIDGPPNNLPYILAILSSPVFLRGEATTKFLADFIFEPQSFTITSAAVECTVQDVPGRMHGSGIPRGGAMDYLALSSGNKLVGNSLACEGLEIVVLPKTSFEAKFNVSAVVSVTGKQVEVTMNGVSTPMWSSFVVPKLGTVRIAVPDDEESPTSGFRVYLCIRGGLPSVPMYLKSKSTSMGLGGYQAMVHWNQGRSLVAGDELTLGNCKPVKDDKNSIQSFPVPLIPRYKHHWLVHVLPGPHDDERFVAMEERDKFYSTTWRTSLSSNRLGIRLESEHKIIWARPSGGEGGSHPSNILDNGYAPGTINVNGDTPVILTADGPDMGGYVSLCTVVSADMWKLGQVQPGDVIRFRPVSWTDSMKLHDSVQAWLSTVEHDLSAAHSAPGEDDLPSTLNTSILAQGSHSEVEVVYRQAGDSAILVEFGPMNLDLGVRALIHAFQTLLVSTNPAGLGSLCPCVRSIMCHYDPTKTTQQDFLSELLRVQKLMPTSVANMSFSGRKFTFPIVLDDPWCREALERYAKTVRQKAVYLPSNVDYLARNNGLRDAREALERLVDCDWIVVGVGFYLGCPFLVPIDPRSRLIAQKMNPSRTFTPRGAVGIAGPVAAIYPVESPGGYQLYGRTLPTWQTWGRGPDFDSMKPWLLQPFDQIHFEVVNASEYAQLEKRFDSGTYKFKIENTVFSMTKYSELVDSTSAEATSFRQQQEVASALESKREHEYLLAWEAEKRARSKEQKSSFNHEGIIFSGAIKTALYASVWKIIFRPGDIIQSPNDVLMILEAMKTEIPVYGGEGNVGKTIAMLGKGISEGAHVRPGDELYLFS